jgi:hypothetical protein
VSRKLLLATEPELEPEEISFGSDRRFGLVFCVVFLVIALWPLLDGRTPRYWALLISCFFFLLAAFAPRILGPLKMLWGKLGARLHHIVMPIIMHLVFFLVVTPVACSMRALGKDPMRLNLDKNAKSYWIERQPAGPEPQTMTRQF